MKPLLVFLLFAWSACSLANNCSVSAGQVAGVPSLLPLPADAAIMQLNSGSYCHGDFILEVVKRTEIYDGTLDLVLKILNTGVSDGVLEVMAPKGITGVLTQRYLITGSRPLPARLAQLLNIDMVHGGLPLAGGVTAPAANWVQVSMSLPYNGRLQLLKNSDQQMAASLVRIALENIITSDQTFIISPEEFWVATERVGQSAASMLRKYVVENQQADWGEKVDLSLAVVNGLITALIHKHISAVASSYNGAFQLTPDEMEIAIDLMGWAANVTAPYDFEETIDDIRSGGMAIVVNNDYVIPDTTIPMYLTGVWTGQIQVIQGRMPSTPGSSDIFYTSFRIEFDPINDEYIVEYPGLGVTGALLVREDEGNDVYSLYEVPDNLSTLSINDGVVRIHTMPWTENILYNWHNAASNEIAMGGMLTKASDNPDRQQIDQQYKKLGDVLKRRVDKQRIFVSTPLVDLPNHILVYFYTSNRVIKLGSRKKLDEAQQYALAAKDYRYLSIKAHGIAEKCLKNNSMSLAYKYLKETEQLVSMAKSQNDIAIQMYNEVIDGIVTDVIRKSALAIVGLSAAGIPSGAYKPAVLSAFKVFKLFTDYQVDSKVHGTNSAITNLIESAIVDLMIVDLGVESYIKKTLDSIQQSSVDSYLKDYLSSSDFRRRVLERMANEAAKTGLKYTVQQLEDGYKTILATYTSNNFNPLNDVTKPTVNRPILDARMICN